MIPNRLTADYGIAVNWCHLSVLVFLESLCDAIISIKKVSLFHHYACYFDYSCSLIINIFSALQGLTNLEYLDVWGSKISDEGAAVLKNFLKLSFLNLSWTNVTKFPNLQSIKCLNMSECAIHSVLEDKSDRVTLKKLIIRGSSFLQAEIVFSTIEPSCLSFLNLSNTSLSYFGFLHRMHALEHLDLSSSAIQDDAVEAISCIGANLRHLNLNNTKVSNAGLETLAGHVPNLEVLSLSHTLIDDFAIAYISMMPSLKELDLSNKNIKGIPELRLLIPKCVGTKLEMTFISITLY